MLTTLTKKQGTLLEAVTPTIERWIAAFLVARRAEGKRESTLTFYRKRLGTFVTYCQNHHVTDIDAIDATLLREFILSLAEHHNAGGQKQYYSVIRALMRWYETEAAPDGWRNPVKKVKPPTVPLPPLESASEASIRAMLTVADARDTVIILTLADCGLRAGELCALRVADFDFATGALSVRQSQTNAGVRVVYCGQKTCKAIRTMLRSRSAKGEKPLFQARGQKPLTYMGLRSVIARLAKEVGVKAPPLHSFRRYAGLSLVRSGVDLITVARVLGHSGIGVLTRYAKIAGTDIQAAMAQHSPADKLGGS